MGRTRESAALSWLGCLGVPVPSYTVIGGNEGLDAKALPPGPPWIVKPDVSLGGKGKLGLVRRCDDKTVLARSVAELLDVSIGCLRPPAVVVEEFIEGREVYLSISIDDRARGPLIRLSASGGVGFNAETEAVGLVARLNEGLYDCQIQQLLATARLADDVLERAVAQLTDILWRAFVASEATLLELNPIRWNGKVATAVGMALEFDNEGRPAASGFRPTLDEDLAAELGRLPTPRERLVAEANDAEPLRPSVKFFELGGDVALLIVGGGASLLCFDYLHERGIMPACYADYSPGAGRAKLQAVVEAGLKVPGVRGALFGAVVVNLVDVMELAEALVKGIEAAGVDPKSFPIVARVAGPNEAAAQNFLRGIPGIVVVGREGTLEDACDVLIERIGQSTSLKSLA